MIGLEKSCAGVSIKEDTKSITNIYLFTESFNWNFSHSLSKWQVSAGTSDWFIVLFAPVVISWNNSRGHTTGFYPGKIVLPRKNFPR